MRLPDFAGTATFGWTLAIAGAFVLRTSLLLGFVYRQSAAYMTSTINSLLTDAPRVIAANSETIEQFIGFALSR